MFSRFAAGVDVAHFCVSGGIMAHIPLSYTHPVGWTNPVTMRASAALPAAGAWDAAPTEQSVAGAGSITLQFTYTRGGAGGAFNWQIQASIYGAVGAVPAGVGEWGDEALYASGAVAAGVDSQSRVQAEYQTFQPTGANAETFVFGPVEIDGTIERVRITAQESGNVANPGTLAIVMECYP
jgi:hypothetical protein